MNVHNNFRSHLHAARCTSRLGFRAEQIEKVYLLNSYSKCMRMQRRKLVRLYKCANNVSEHGSDAGKGFELVFPRKGWSDIEEKV